MRKLSAGILVYKRINNQVEVLLAHPGGPFWAKKDLGAWSIPKGEYEEDEDPFDAAKREFKEEIGQNAPSGDYYELGESKQKSGKIIMAWAVEADLDAGQVKSNTFEMEWPPRSGQKQEFPEIDKAEWFFLNKATKKINQGQQVFLERLIEKLQIEKPKPEEPNQQQLL
jgi:predicted NUDIX family NTP pyrophosphohydrolase